MVTFRMNIANRIGSSLSVWGALVIVFLFIACATSPVLAQITQVNKTAGVHTFMGTATCASSNCHGSAAPRNASNVLQNEYVTWQKHDRHALAYTILEGDESKRIAYNLGIEAPEKEPLCLDCHATHVASSKHQGEKFRIEDGVSCESCHGAAEGWLKEHTESGATHKRNLELGMTDVIDPVKRTKLCASCHFGTEDKTVNHRLIGAGHPRLAFELDTFSQIQPRHWLVDEDYIKRKSDYNSAQAWLIGQVTLADEAIEKLLSHKNGQYGLMPELTLMYCYSCHHSLTELQWKKRDYAGKPGELRLNIAHLIIVGEALKVINAGLAQSLEASINDLHGGYGKEDVREAAKRIQSVLRGKILPAMQGAVLDERSLRALLKGVIAYAANTPYLQYEVAEQVAMAASSIVAARDPEGKLFQLQIDTLYKTLRTPESFMAEEFTSSAQSFLKSL